MTEAQTDLAFALKMYGEKCVEAAQAQTIAEGASDTHGISRAAWDTAYDNMVFWQNQLWMCSKAVAKEKLAA